MHPTRIFKDSDELEKVWESFKKDVKEQSNEWVKVQYVGKDGIRVEEPTKVPLTFEGFKRYCRKEYGEVEQYFTNQGEYYSEFVGICRAIKNEIRENQIIGGLLGFHNPSITQRLNGLKEQVESEVKNSISILNIDPLDDSTDHLLTKDSKS